MAGAPIGNKNAAKAKLWTAAIERALENRSRKQGKQALDELAEKLLVACDAGEGWALKELGDRLEGRPVTPIEQTGDINHHYVVMTNPEAKSTEEWQQQHAPTIQ